MANRRRASSATDQTGLGVREEPDGGARLKIHRIKAEDGPISLVVDRPSKLTVLTAEQYEALGLVNQMQMRGKVKQIAEGIYLAIQAITPN